MIDKIVSGLDATLDGIESGSTILVSGFGNAGRPTRCSIHLPRRELPRLDRWSPTTLASDRTGSPSCSLQARSDAWLPRYPRNANGAIFDELYRTNGVELELVHKARCQSESVPLARESLGSTPRPASARCSPKARNTVDFDGRTYLLETPISADWALIRGKQADRWGNVTYNKSQRNFGPTMAMAGATTVVEVSEIVPIGQLDPETIVTPGVFVSRVVQVPG